MKYSKFRLLTNKVYKQYFYFYFNSSTTGDTAMVPSLDLFLQFSLSCPGCPVAAIQFWLSCRGCHVRSCCIVLTSVPGFLIWLLFCYNCAGHPGFALGAFQSCLSCPVAPSCLAIVAKITDTNH
jgi:hypothetical protein